MNLFESMNFSRRLLTTEKKILPIVFVKAMGRNSAGSAVLLDLENRSTVADAQLCRISLVFHTFAKMVCACPGRRIYHSGKAQHRYVFVGEHLEFLFRLDNLLKGNVKELGVFSFPERDEGMVSS